MRTICARGHPFRVRWLFVFLIACTGEPQEADVRWFDEKVFERDVQPILAARCASPLCHGRPERPLSIHGAFRWRDDPTRLWIDEPLTREEMSHDYISTCVVEATGDPSESPVLLRKSLGDRAGVFHGGGVIFEKDDPDYATLAAWLR